MRAERLGLFLPYAVFGGNKPLGHPGHSRAGAADYLIIDSIQTIYHEDITSAAGSVSQVRECAAALARMAKSTGIALFIVGHVTKDGNIAGPGCWSTWWIRCCISRASGPAPSAFCARSKNRFGSTNEIGVFDMGNLGMTEVQNPSAILLEGRQKDMAGSCIYCALEGRALCFWK